MSLAAAFQVYSLFLLLFEKSYAACYKKYFSYFGLGKEKLFYEHWLMDFFPLELVYMIWFYLLNLERKQSDNGHEKQPW